jgi:hypothetical protein
MFYVTNETTQQSSHKAKQIATHLQRYGGIGRTSTPNYPYSPTTTFAFGASPNTSGAYIASTRVAGSENSPALLRRSV